MKVSHKSVYSSYIANNIPDISSYMPMSNSGVTGIAAIQLDHRLQIQLSDQFLRSLLDNDRSWSLSNNDLSWSLLNNGHLWSLLNNGHLWSLSNNDCLWSLLNNGRSWSLLNDDHSWSLLEVQNNPNKVQKQSYFVIMKNLINVLFSIFKEYVCCSFQQASAHFLWSFYFGRPGFSRHIRYLILVLRRFCLFKHDFKALLIKNFCYDTIFNYLFFPMAYPMQALIIFNIFSNLINPILAEWPAYKPVNVSNCTSTTYSACIGGGKQYPLLKFETIKPFLHTSCTSKPIEPDIAMFSYVDHIPLDALNSSLLADGGIACLLPLRILEGHCSLAQAKHIAKVHNLPKFA